MRVIYIDDEELAVLKFKMTMEKIDGVDSFMTFCRAYDGLEYVRTHEVDVAFLDIEMTDVNGLELATELKKLQEDIRIVFVTAYSEYALDAFGVDAIGYLMKPYNTAQLEKEIRKVATIHHDKKKRIYIQTMPNFDVFIDDKLVPISRKKAKELLALLVDRRGNAVSVGLAISCLWENRPYDESSKALFRMTLKRLKDILETEGMGNILDAEHGQRAIRTSEFDCDFYQILDGDEKALKKYQGEYMSEYTWAEDTNAKLSDISYRWNDKEQ